MENKAEKVVGYDYMLLIPTLLLMTFGLVAVYSASSFLAEHKMGDSYYYLKKQGMFCLVGLFLMICAKERPKHCVHENGLSSPRNQFLPRASWFLSRG